jgi:hypothetical protein
MYNLFEENMKINFDIEKKSDYINCSLYFLILFKTKLNILCFDWLDIFFKRIKIKIITF